MAAATRRRPRASIELAADGAGRYDAGWCRRAKHQARAVAPGSGRSRRATTGQNRSGAAGAHRPRTPQA
ncbi:MAG: hypothetical protein OJF60_001621 [Burkholderiaceae bacterium]|nr:MAG: hypothetical protein OJF60_001621 [Burkholderiaceae bacterium]